MKPTLATLSLAALLISLSASLASADSITLHDQAPTASCMTGHSIASQADAHSPTMRLAGGFRRKQDPLTASLAAAPEPTTVALLVAGLPLMLQARRKAAGLEQSRKAAARTA